MLSYFATYFLHQTSSNHEYMWKKTWFILIPSNFPGPKISTFAIFRTLQDLLFEICPPSLHLGEKQEISSHSKISAHRWPWKAWIAVWSVCEYLKNVKYLEKVCDTKNLTLARRSAFVRLITSLVFLVAVSLASVVFEGRTHASEWHWAYLQRLDLVVGLPCPDVQRGMCSHFWWEEHKNFPQKNQKFPPRFFLIETKDFQKTSKTTISFSHFNGAEGFLYFWPLDFPIRYTIHLTRTIRTHV